MANKRNYYRILQVQPDAPLAAIRHNFRLLMLGLNMHPDYGGDEEQAKLINTAYSVLSDPEKRAAYDRQLLSRYNIGRLAQGHLWPVKYLTIEDEKSPVSYPDENLRNYYRLLQIQPDAQGLIIRERYAYLANEAEIDRKFLEEAYRVLKDPEIRAAYDRLLIDHGHRKAVRKLRRRIGSLDQGEIGQKDGILGQLLELCGLYRATDRPGPNPAGKGPGPQDQAQQAPESQPSRAWSRRDLERVKRTEGISLYTAWPGRQFSGLLHDFSPQGLSFLSRLDLEPGQVLTINANWFRAVAEVVHCREVDGQKSNTGVRFQSIDFSQDKGNLVWASG